MKTAATQITARGLSQPDARCGILLTDSVRQIARFCRRGDADLISIPPLDDRRHRQRLLLPQRLESGDHPGAVARAAVLARLPSAADGDQLAFGPARRPALHRDGIGPLVPAPPPPR